MDGHLNCSELENRLNDLLDQRKDPADDPLISAHIEFCPECNALVRSHLLVQQSIEDSKASIDEMDVDVSNSVVNNWAHLFPEPQTKAWRYSSIAIIICLLILMPVGLIWVTWPRDNDSQVNPVAAVHDDNQNESERATENGKNSLDDTDYDLAVDTIQNMMDTADDQLEWLNPYRPTMQLFGVSTMVESLDFTLDLILDRLPDEKENKDSPPSKGDK